MKSIFVVGNQSKPLCEDVVRELGLKLDGKAKLVGTSFSKDVVLPDEPIDLLISLGGDGSFLNLVEKVLEREIPIMGVNFGRLGFLTAGLAVELDSIMDAFLNSETEIYDRMMLSVDIPGREIFPRSALNDVLVCAPDLGRVISLEVRVSDEPLIQFRGDGMIISTPTGSTAHSLSAGGSLVDPQVEAILLTPLNSQSMSSRPFVVRPEARMEVTISSDGGPAKAFCDGKSLGEVQPGQSVSVYRHPNRIKMVQPKSFRFMSRLADKLGWSETLS